jgi:hypothetical protein
MSRFRVLHKHKVLGTDQVVWLAPMSGVETREIRGSVLAGLSEALEEEANLPIAEKIRKLDEDEDRACRAVWMHTYNDQDGTELTFGSEAAVLEELSPGQREDLGKAILVVSGYTPAAREAAQRFREDGEGQAGGVPDSPAGQGVRAAS